MIVGDDDPTAQQLLAAVWADPTADAPRMVYADYLQDRGDPLGELIALQLERSRTGDAAGDRELALLEDHATRAARPLEPLISRFTLDRGFVARCTTLANISQELADHPAWATVERLATHASTDRVLRNPHLSQPTLALDDKVAFELSRDTQPLPAVALAGIEPRHGVSVSTERLALFDHRGAFDRVRALSLNAWWLERILDERTPILDSKLITQLAHLDLTFTSVRFDDLRMWRKWFATSPLARLSFQVPLADAGPPPRMVGNAVWPGRPTHFFCLAIDRATDQLILQLSQPTPPHLVETLLETAALVGAGKSRVEIMDLEAPNRIEARQRDVVQGLPRYFTDVAVVKGPVRPIAP